MSAGTAPMQALSFFQGEEGQSLFRGVAEKLLLTTEVIRSKKGRRSLCRAFFSLLKNPMLLAVYSLILSLCWLYMISVCKLGGGKGSFALLMMRQRQ